MYCDFMAAVRSTLAAGHGGIGGSHSPQAAFKCGSVEMGAMHHCGNFRSPSLCAPSPLPPSISLPTLTAAPSTLPPFTPPLAPPPLSLPPLTRHCLLPVPRHCPLFPCSPTPPHTLYLTAKIARRSLEAKGRSPWSMNSFRALWSVGKVWTHIITSPLSRRGE